MAEGISIIVPVYNVASDLPRCLDSILAQTFPEIEIIVVDDGSSDTSGEILDFYAGLHTNIHAIHKENGGVSSARLRGVQEAHGDWIGFVDGDDEIEPDMYERLLRNAQRYRADISHCGYQMMFADGRVNYFHNSGVVEQHNKTAALKELLSGNRIEPSLCNKLFRISLFQGLEIDGDIKINEDLLMNFYLFCAADQSVFEDFCPYHYIVHGFSASRQKLNSHKIYDPIRVKEIVRQAAPDNIREDAQRAYVNTCINTYHALLGAGAAYLDDLRQVRSLLKREKSSLSLLGKKRAWMAFLITCVPLIYKPIYAFYCRFIQNSKYL